MTHTDPTPSDLYRVSNDATSSPSVSERCGDTITGRGLRFCSRACCDEAVADELYVPPARMTFEEMQAEMEGVLNRLAAYDEEETS